MRYGLTVEPRKKKFKQVMQRYEDKSMMDILHTELLRLWECQFPISYLKILIH
jgi:hypothetical protein